MGVRAALLVLVVGWLPAIGGCSADEDDHELADAGPGPAPDGGARIAVGATDGVLELDFTVDIEAEGVGRIGAVSIDGAAGTVAIHGADHPALVYQMQPWPDFDYTLFQTLAVGVDRWYVLWFYCRDGAVEAIYSEGTDGTALDWEQATGTCVYETSASSVPVALPAGDLPQPALVGGYTISGPGIELEGTQPGRIMLGGREHIVLAFEGVVCVGICGDSDWHELHALLVDPAAARVCFGIFYLRLDAPGSVLLTYSITLPDLIDPAGALELPATWTAPAAAGRQPGLARPPGPDPRFLDDHAPQP